MIDKIASSVYTSLPEKTKRREARWMIRVLGDLNFKFLSEHHNYDDCLFRNCITEICGNTAKYLNKNPTLFCQLPNLSLNTKRITCSSLCLPVMPVLSPLMSRLVVPKVLLSRKEPCKNLLGWGGNFSNMIPWICKSEKYEKMGTSVFL